MQASLRNRNKSHTPRMSAATFRCIATEEGKEGRGEGGEKRHPGSGTAAALKYPRNHGTALAFETKAERRAACTEVRGEKHKTQKKRRSGERGLGEGEERRCARRPRSNTCGEQLPHHPCTNKRLKRSGGEGKKKEEAAPRQRVTRDRCRWELEAGEVLLSFSPRRANLCAQTGTNGTRGDRSSQEPSNDCIALNKETASIHFGTGAIHQPVGGVGDQKVEEAKKENRGACLHICITAVTSSQKRACHVHQQCVRYTA